MCEHQQPQHAGRGHRWCCCCCCRRQHRAFTQAVPWQRCHTHLPSICIIPWWPWRTRHPWRCTSKAGRCRRHCGQWTKWRPCMCMHACHCCTAHKGSSTKHARGRSRADNVLRHSPGLYPGMLLPGSGGPGGRKLALKLGGACGCGNPPACCCGCGGCCGCSCCCIMPARQAGSRIAASMLLRPREGGQCWPHRLLRAHLVAPCQRLGGPASAWATQTPQAAAGAQAEEHRPPVALQEASPARLLPCQVSGLPACRQLLLALPLASCQAAARLLHQAWVLPVLVGRCNAALLAEADRRAAARQLQRPALCACAAAATHTAGA